MDREAVKILVLVGLGTALILLLAGSIIFFVIYYQKRMLHNQIARQALEADHQRQLLQSTIDSQEKERKRIASDLHDGVGAILSAAKLNLNLLRTGAIPEEELPAALGETKEMIEETIETVRRISKDLLPSSLEAFGLSIAIRELCDKLDNPQTRILFYENKEPISLPKQQELLLYRIVQELVNNALKHAGASEINIGIHWGEIIEIKVQDDGRGFNRDEIKQNVGTGVGLYNIESRASLVGASVMFDSEPGSGTTVKLCMNAEHAENSKAL